MSSQMEFKDFTIRVEKKSGFSTLHNTMLRDRRLSFEARGCLGYALSRPNGWQFWASDLMKEGAIGRDQLYSILKELVLYGYMQKFRRRVSQGKFEWQTIMYEQSQERKPFADNMPRHIICMLRCGPFYSVAITSTPKQLLENFQYGNPYQIQVLKMVDAGSEPAAAKMKAEADARYQKNGADWFRLGSKDVAALAKLLQMASKRPPPDNPTMVPPPEKPEMAARSVNHPPPEYPHTAQPLVDKPSIYEVLTEEERSEERTIAGSSADDLKGGNPQASIEPKPARRITIADEVDEAVDFWKRWMKRPASKLAKGSKRDRNIRARFKDGFGVKDIWLGVIGCRLTPHNMGDNPQHRKFNDIELICRSLENLEGFIETAHAAGWTLDNIDARLAPAPAPEPEAVPEDEPDDDEITGHPWSTVMEKAATVIDGQTFATWFRPLKCVGLDMQAMRITIRAPNHIVRDWIVGKYSHVLEQAFQGTGYEKFALEWITSPKRKERRPCQTSSSQAQSSLLDLESIQQTSEASH